MRFVLRVRKQTNHVDGLLSTKNIRHGRYDKLSIAEQKRADEYLTQTLKTVLAMIDVRVIDHMVVAGGRVVSFAERGLL